MVHIDLKQVARLARLHLTEAEMKLLEPQLGQILSFVESLKEVKVEGVEPTSHPLSLSNVFREDQPHVKAVEPERIQAFIKNSPASRGSFFEVPKIIEDKS
ncbi:MAG: Asp-tRNA(Asn)/Glu-tRNA(Gln) amidotransferase subunit GatC [Candidatus Omnitrophica bacterium]|nr:Asp-tRNA(Asn)/Glu-tRNA(Gln) amidotransferase subunit GatC [Candidatus Omnitrophota bacterium]